MKLSKTIILLIIIVISNICTAQNEKFKALFIYNFTKNILWPGDYSKGDFIIGVLGNSAIISELNVIANKKQVNGQTIKIEKFSSPESVSKCHLLYIPEYNSSKLPDICRMLNNQPTVIVTDSNNKAKEGASINLVLKDGSQNFEIFKDKISSNGIQVNPKLLSLGIIK